MTPEEQVNTKDDLETIVDEVEKLRRVVRAQFAREAAEWHEVNVQAASNFADAEYWRGIKYANEKAVEHFSALAEKEGAG